VSGEEDKEYLQELALIHPVLSLYSVFMDPIFGILTELALHLTYATV